MSNVFSPILLVGTASEPPLWLRQGIPHGTPVHCATNVAAARTILWKGEIKILICEAVDALGEPTDALLEAAVLDFPSIATLAIVGKTDADSDTMLRVARTGVHSMLFSENRRLPLLVRRAITDALTRCRQAIVWDRIGPETPDRVRPIVAYGLKHANQSLTVDSVARALGLHRKTLAERCSLAGTMPPQQMLGWCRLLAAAVLLEDRGRAVDHIANELDFPSGAAFRNMLKRYTGLNPAELRARGTIKEMSRQFARAVAPGRWDQAEIRAS